MGQRSGYPDLVAVLPDAPAARRVIERLSRAGVDGGAIVLLEPAESLLAARHDDRRTDLGSLRALVLRALGVGAAGAVVGALVGLGVFALAGQRSPAALAAGALGGAAFGASVGVVLGLLAQPTMVGPWERTFAPRAPGVVVVGVRVEDARTDGRARAALRGVPSLQEVVDLDVLPPHDEP